MFSCLKTNNYFYPFNYNNDNNYYLFFQQIFIEHLLCDKHCFNYWGYRSGPHGMQGSTSMRKHNEEGNELGCQRVIRTMENNEAGMVKVRMEKQWDTI